jgi:quinohemoprotein ethanol dehydrogenase
VAKGKILMGYNGSDDGVRGALVAYDAETGKEAWRFWTVPGDPSKPFETKALEVARIGGRSAAATCGPQLPTTTRRGW